MASAHARVLDELRGRIARIERAGRPQHRIVPFGLAEIDAHLPQGGLVIGALHEIAGGLGAMPLRPCCSSPAYSRVLTAPSCGVCAPAICSRQRSPAPDYIPTASS